MQNRIEDSLFQLVKESWKVGGYSGMVADAVTWYIATGRASTPWVNAFIAGNPAAIVRRGLAGDMATNEIIRRVTAYLRRYCGLRY